MPLFTEPKGMSQPKVEWLREGCGARVVAGGKTRQVEMPAE